MTGPLAWGRAKIVERWNKSLGTSSTIINLIVLDADDRRDILRPDLTTEREQFYFDQSIEARAEVRWLFRSVEVRYHRPYTRREWRRARQAHDREMAEMRARADAAVAAREGA